MTERSNNEVCSRNAVWLDPRLVPAIDNPEFVQGFWEDFAEKYHINPDLAGSPPWYSPLLKVAAVGLIFGFGVVAGANFQGIKFRSASEGNGQPTVRGIETEIPRGDGTHSEVLPSSELPAQNPSTPGGPHGTALVEHRPLVPEPPNGVLVSDDGYQQGDSDEERSTEKRQRRKVTVRRMRQQILEEVETEEELVETKREKPVQMQRPTAKDIRAAIYQDGGKI